MFPVADSTQDDGSSNSSSAKQQSAAVDMVRCWRARGRVPLAVDCTAQLVELQLQHALPAAAAASSAVRPPAPACSTLASRHQYSLCLLRLVNGILDPQQSKQHAQSIASLAKQVDLPRILVDIRHEATHQQLPSLPMLQMAARAALEWLQRHYWNAQSHALSKTEDTLRAQLKAYKKALERSAAAAAASGSKTSARDEAAIAVSVNNGDTILLSDAAAAPSITALPEKAVESLKSLFSFLSSGHTLAHTKSIVESTLVPLLLSDAAMIKPPKQSRVSLTSVFRRLVETWDAALGVLAQRLKSQAINLPQMLLHAIVARLVRAQSLKKQDASSHWEPDLLREWALHLINAYASSIFREPSVSASSSSEPASASSGTPAKKRSHATAMAAAADSAAASSSASSPLDTLLHSCLTHLNPWTLALVSVLFPLFKASHGAQPHTAEAVKSLEALLAVTTRALFPEQRFGAAPAAKASNLTPLANIRAFIAAHSSTAAVAPAAAPSACATASSSSSSACAAASGSLMERALDFPFLPLGVAPGDAQQDLWLEDDWFDPSAPVSAVAVASQLAAPAAAVVAVESMDDDAEPVPIAATEAVASADSRPNAAPVAKRARIGDVVDVAAQKRAHASALERQVEALSRLQQSVQWM